MFGTRSAHFCCLNQHMLMSPLGVGIGVGLGLGLASGSQNVSRLRGGDTGITPLMMEQEILGVIVNGRDNSVTFDQFPYYLSEQMTSAAFVHLKKGDLTKHTRNISPASRPILLSGPADTDQQMLAKALAHYFQAKLLLLDVTDFSLKMQSKYGAPNKVTSFKRSVSETSWVECRSFSDLFHSFDQLLKIKV